MSEASKMMVNSKLGHAQSVVQSGSFFAFLLVALLATGGCGGKTDSGEGKKIVAPVLSQLLRSLSNPAARQNENNQNRPQNTSNGNGNNNDVPINTGGVIGAPVPPIEIEDDLSPAVSLSLAAPAGVGQTAQSNGCEETNIPTQEQGQTCTMRTCTERTSRSFAMNCISAVSEQYSCGAKTYTVTDAKVSVSGSFSFDPSNTNAGTTTLEQSPMELVLEAKVSGGDFTNAKVECKLQIAVPRVATTRNSMLQSLTVSPTTTTSTSPSFPTTSSTPTATPQPAANDPNACWENYSCKIDGAEIPCADLRKELEQQQPSCSTQN